MFVLFPIETPFLANMTVFMPISTLSPIEITPPLQVSTLVKS